MWFKRYDVQETFNMYGTKVPVFIVVPQFNDSVHHYFCAAWPSLLKARFDSGLWAKATCSASARTYIVRGTYWVGCGAPVIGARDMMFGVIKKVPG